MMISSELGVGKIAAEHPIATRVFARHGIDFCCGGGRALQDVCQKNGLDTASIVAEIEAELSSAPSSSTRWDQAPLTDLIDHILVTFHEPLREELPRLQSMAQKVHDVHGDKDPERLAEVLSVVLALRQELELHMAKEERILFPMIQQNRGALMRGPISVMETEHDAAGDALRRLRELTDNYQPAPGACNTWIALWAGLERLESDLHEHIHLENNILFPRALAE